MVDVKEKNYTLLKKALDSLFHSGFFSPTFPQTDARIPNACSHHKSPYFKTIILFQYGMDRKGLPITKKKKWRKKV
jgi:hypothetical protein